MLVVIHRSTGGAVVCNRDKGVTDHIIPAAARVDIQKRRWDEMRDPLPDDGVAHGEMELPRVDGRALDPQEEQAAPGRQRVGVVEEAAVLGEKQREIGRF